MIYSGLEEEKSRYDCSLGEGAEVFLKKCGKDAKLIICDTDEYMMSKKL